MPTNVKLNCAISQQLPLPSSYNLHEKSMTYWFKITDVFITLTYVLLIDKYLSDLFRVR